MHKKAILITIGIIFFAVVVKVGFSLGNFFPVASRVLFHRAQALKSTNGRTSILLLGTGGANHDGPNLTDTMIYATIDTTKNTVTLISIPRDLWMPDLAQKINFAYAKGEASGQHKGLLLAKAEVAHVLGQPVDYGFRIDFSGFVKAIDLVGGLDIQVQNTLDDYQYPIDGKESDPCGHTDEEIQAFAASASATADMTFFPCRFKHLHFDAGMQHMDGQTALEFVRSRHGVGSEGSDFARSRRQQLVIEAFRGKVFSAQTIFNPGKIIGLYTILQQSIDTDVMQEEFTLFLDLAQKVQHAKITSYVLDYGDDATGRAGLLINPPIDAAYNFASVLIPRIGDGNYSEIQTFVACEIQKGNCIVSANSGN